MKRSPDRELLDWEELEDAPNTRGAFSFLRSQPVVIDIGQHVRSAPVVDNFPMMGDKTSSVDVLPRPSVEPSPVDPQRSRRRPYVPHRCHLVQDAHSAGETQLLTMLWKYSSPEETGNRTITIGFDRMAKLARMSDKAAKRNINALIKKLAVEVVRAEVSSTRTGRTYRVFSYELILEKRRAAGLLYVERDKGVRFVDPPRDTEHPQARASSKTSTVDDMSTVDKTSPDTVDKTSTVSVDITSPETGDITSPPLSSLLSNRTKQTTTTEDLEPIVSTLLEFVGAADDHAARKILSECRLRCEDATPEEIARIVAMKARDIMQDRNVVRPIGLLISAIPKCFEGATILHLRRRWTMEREAKRRKEQEEAEQRAEMERWFRQRRSQCEAVLQDPTSSNLQRKSAEIEIKQIEAALAEDDR